MHNQKEQCERLVNCFLEICDEIKFSVAEDKTVKPTPRVAFLGILLDGERRCLAVPEDKVVRTRNLLQEMSSKKCATVKQIQRLAGTLNFLVRAIHPGRPFLLQMYAKYSEIALGKTKLKHFHHVKVDHEFRLDCGIWILFLQNQSVVARPFIDQLKPELTSTNLNFFTDSSKAVDKGFGCVFGTQWTYAPWEIGYIQKFDPSIAYL